MSRPLRRILLAGIGAVTGLVLALLWVGTPGSNASDPAAPGPFAGSPASFEVPFEDAQGTDHRGGTVQLGDLLGQASVLFFGFTRCPDVCPLTMARVARAIDALPATERMRVRVVFVTVDPERDGDTELAGFVSRFGPRFVGVRLDPERLAPVLDRYGITVVPGAHPPDPDGAAAAITHTSRAFGLDRDGALRVTWGSDAPPEAIAADLARLLDL